MTTLGGGWKILTEHSTSISPSFLVKTSRFIHDLSNFQCVFVDLGQSTALFTSSLVVPTFAHNHKGLAHTLEHLIFCGSRLYPEKGTLDQVANGFLSNGTNAYTAEDHTCYTFNTCLVDGLKEILPIFLDHIFFPTLKREHFYTEVNHVVEQDKLGGVVFCEMQAREHSEADLCELAVKASIFGPKSAYAMECGGKTQEISELTLDEVVEFHRKFYHPNFCTLILCGNLSSHFESILSLIDRFFEGASFDVIQDCKSELQLNLADSYEEKEEQKKKEIRFPAAEEESVGSLVFAWKGPHLLQLQEIHSLDLVLKFLNENSSSLLQQSFVELESPLATSVSHDIYSFVPITGFSISFSGTKQENHPEIRNKLISILQSISDSLDLAAFGEFLSRTKEKLIFSFENAPLDFANQMIIPEVLANSYLDSNAVVLGTNFQILQIIDELSLKEKNHFVELISRFFNADFASEIAMIPSMEMNQEVKDALSSICNAKFNNCSTEELVEMKKALEQTKSTNIPPQKSLVKQLSPNDFISCENANEYNLSTFGHVQIVELKSQFTYLCLCIPLKGLPTELKRYLVLFQELFFQTDINVEISLPDAFPLGITPYEQVVSCISRTFISHSCSVGMDNDVFSCSYFSDYLVISGCSSSQKQHSMFALILQILCGLSFSSQRVRTIASNLKNDLSELKREPEEMLDFLSTRILLLPNQSQNAPKRLKMEESNWNDVSIGIFQQEKHLPFVIKNPEEAIQRLLELKQWILQSCASSNCILQLAGSFEKEKLLDLVLGQWKISFPNAFQNENLQFSYALPTIKPSTNSLVGKQFAYSMKCASTCHLSAILPIEMPFHEIASNEIEYYSLVCICKLLAATEGPLYSRIRGEGLAYRVDLSIAIFNQQIILTIGESVNPFLAFKEFEVILQTILDDLDSFFSISNLNTAKSLVLYQIQENKSSPYAILTDKFKDFIARGAFKQNTKVILSILTQEHLKAAFCKYFANFCANAIVFAVGPESCMQQVESFDSLKEFYLS